MIAFDPGLTTVNCTSCRTLTAAANLDGCYVCNEFDDVCGACLRRHMDHHSKGEIAKADAEILA